MESLTNAPSGRPSAAEDKKRSELEEKKLYFALRSPQKELDPRIVEMAKSDQVSEDDVPYLHYGLVFRRDEFDSFIIRKNIEVPLRKTPGYLLLCRSAVERYLAEKCHFRSIYLVFPLEMDHEHWVVALDDTSRLRHTKIRRWDKVVAPVLQTIRDELGLGDQQPMWWWDSQYGQGFVSPIPDYNPPEVNQEIERMRALFRGEPEFDFSSDSDSGSDTATED